MSFHPHPVHRVILRHVLTHPGCTKYAAAEAGTWHPQRDPSKQYYLVNTLIRWGYITAEAGKGNAYSLRIAEDQIEYVKDLEPYSWKS